jgi:hypothetical protein
VTSPKALFDRDSSLFVARGLYILRYQSGAESSEHPVAAAAPAPGFENVIQVISAPGSTEGGLERPGAAVLIRAADNGKLRIGVRRRSSNGSLDAAFKLESVGVSSTRKPRRSIRAQLRCARLQRPKLVLQGMRTALKEPCSWRTYLDAATCRSRRTNGLAVPTRRAASKGWKSSVLARRDSRPKRGCCLVEGTRLGQSGSASAYSVGHEGETSHSSAFG